MRIDKFKKYVIQNLSENTWLSSPMWVGWLTQLDQSGLWYLMDNDYNLLMLITKMAVLYIQVWCDQISFRAVTDTVRKPAITDTNTTCVIFQ